MCFFYYLQCFLLMLASNVSLFHMQGVGLVATVLIWAALLGLGAASDAPVAYSLRLLFMIVMQPALGEVLAVVFLQLPRRVRGETHGSWYPSEEERVRNESSPEWPSSSKLLPKEYKKGPRFINHTCGALRLKCMVMRLGMMVSSVLSTVLALQCLDHRQEYSFNILPMDMVYGALTGATIVTFMFLAQVSLNWVTVLDYLTVFDPADSLPLNLLIETLFHTAVAINEELPVRGYMLLNLSEWLHSSSALSYRSSMTLAIALQSMWFVIMHLGSPGGSRWQSMLNIFAGGVAAGLNVLLTGGLGFVLGWHWAWNLTMGNVFGLSTSGIPVSGTLVEVLPHPRKEHLHGGVFGPEGGAMAAPAYALGVAILAYLYV